MTGTKHTVGLLVDKLAVLAGFSCLFPYLAVPVSPNVSVPLASLLILATIVVSVLCRSAYAPPVIAAALVAWPVLHGIVLAVILSAYDTVNSGVVFAAGAFPVLVSMVGVVGMQRAYEGLLVGTIIAAVLVVGQWLLLSLQVVPLREIYWLASYPEPWPFIEGANFSQVRPFGWFPEPSFMAGSLASVGMLVLLRNFHGALSRRELSVLALTTLCIAASGSGTALIYLPAMALIMAKRYGVSSPGVLILVPLGLTTLAFFVVGLIGKRTRSTDWSWGDRAESIRSGVQYCFSQSDCALIGVGKGEVARLFQSRSIPVTANDLAYYPRDMYSLLGRYFVELGAIGLLIVAALLVAMVVAAFRATGSHAVAYTAGTALAMVGATVLTYETVSTYWVALGFLLSSSKMQAAVTNGGTRARHDVCC